MQVIVLTKKGVFIEIVIHWNQLQNRSFHVFWGDKDQRRDDSEHIAQNLSIFFVIMSISFSFEI